MDSYPQTKRMKFGFKFSNSILQFTPYNHSFSHTHKTLTFFALCWGGAPVAKLGRENKAHPTYLLYHHQIPPVGNISIFECSMCTCTHRCGCAYVFVRCIHMCNIWCLCVCSCVARKKNYRGNLCNYNVCPDYTGTLMNTFQQCEAKKHVEAHPQENFENCSFLRLNLVLKVQLLQ